MIWTGNPKIRSLARFFEARWFLSIVLVGVFLWSLTGVDWNGSIVHSGGGSSFKDFSLGLFPPELSPGFMKLAIIASWQTVVHAVAGMTLAVII